MPRKRKSGADLNLDSLMDALTNVVGILVIVLVVTSLDVSSAVQRIKRLNPEEFDISPMDVALAQREVDQNREDFEKLRLAAVSSNRPLAELNDAQKRLAELKAKPVAIDEDADIAALDKLVAERKKKWEELEKQVTTNQDEIAKLKSMLDDTPVLAAPAPKVVKVPNPRAAPKEIKPLTVMCRNGRVIPFDPTKLTERAKKRLEFLARPLMAKAGAGGAIDCDALVTSYNVSKIADANFRTKLLVQNYNLYLEFTYQGGGEATDKLASKSSDLQRLLKRVDPQAYFIQFWVWQDSFDTYVEARRICDEYGVLAGWTPYHESYQWKTGLGVKVACKGKPAPKPVKPAPPGTKPPPPPKPLPSDQID